MAAPRAGKLVVEIVGDADREQFVKDINLAVKDVGVTIPVKLKLGKNEVRDILKEVKTDLKARKRFPTIPVKLALEPKAVANLYADINAQIAARKNPVVKVDVELNDADLATTVAAASKVTKAKRPKLKVDIDIGSDKTLLVDARAAVEKVQLAVSANPIEIPLKVDSAARARIAEKVVGQITAAKAKLAQEIEDLDDVRAVAEAKAFSNELGRAEARQLLREQLDDDFARNLAMRSAQRLKDTDDRLAEADKKLDDGIRKRYELRDIIAETAEEENFGKEIGRIRARISERFRLEEQLERDLAIKRRDREAGAPARIDEAGGKRQKIIDVDAANLPKIVDIKQAEAFGRVLGDIEARFKNHGVLMQKLADELEIRRVDRARAMEDRLLERRLGADDRIAESARRREEGILVDARRISEIMETEEGKSFARRIGLTRANIAQLDDLLKEQWLKGLQQQELRERGKGARLLEFDERLALQRASKALGMDERLLEARLKKQQDYDLRFMNAEELRIEEAWKLELRRIDRERGMAARVEEDKLKDAERSVNRRALEEVKHMNRVALLHERAEIAKRNSSGITLRVLRNDLSQFDQTTTRILRRTLLGFGLLNAGIAAGFAATAAAAIVQFGKIEQAANKAASLFTSQTLGGSGLTGEAFKNQLLTLNRANTEAITDTSRQVAVETKFNTEEIAEGFRFLAGAGVELQNSLKSIPTVARLAQAGFMELEDTSDLVVQGFIAAGGDINKFGEEIEGLGDKLVFVANESAVTLEEVMKAFSNRAGASFKAAGQTADEALNVIRLFGQTGIKGLKAGEQSAILIREITRSATLKAPKAWKQLGIEISNADGSARSFAVVLDDLTRVLAKRTDNFRKPGELVKVLNEELQLTEKSSGGLRQLIPSIAELQRRGSGAAEALNQLQTQSAGRLSAQTEAVTDTLAFQFEAFGNNISNLASEFATSAGGALTDFFKGVNGGADGTASLFKRLSGEAERYGKSFGKFMRRALDGLRGEEGKEFFTGIVEGVKSSLTGIVGLFTEFRTQVFGQGSDKGFFAIVGDAFEAFGNFSERTLPRIGRLLGIITSFVRENTLAVKLFVLQWGGLFLFSKALRLFIIPLVGLTTNMKALRESIVAITSINFVRTMTAWTAGMFGFTTQTMRADAAMKSLVATQTAAAVSAAATGRGAGKAGKLAAGTAGPETAAVAAAANQGKLAAALSRVKVSAAAAAVWIKGINVDFGKLARATIIIPVVLGIVKGALDQLNESFGGDGKTSLRDFGNAMLAVGRAIGKVVGPVITLLGWIGKLLFELGKLVGMILTWGIVSLFEAIWWAVKKLGGALKDLGGWISDTAKRFPELTNAVLSTIPGAKELLATYKELKKLGGDGGLEIPAPEGQEWDFSRQSEGIQNIGTSLTFLADGWEKAGADGISETFRDMSESVTHNNKTLNENIAANMKANEARRKAFEDEQKRIAAKAKKEFDATNVLGFATDRLSAKYFRMTAIQKAQRLSVDQAMAQASNYQQRQHNLGIVTDILSGKLKNASAMTRILAGSTKNAGINLTRLAGGKAGLNSMLESIRMGNKKAADSFIKLSEVAGMADMRLTQLHAKAAQRQLDLINAGGGMPSAAAGAAIMRQIEAGRNATAEYNTFMQEQRDLVAQLTSTEAFGGGAVTAAGDAAAAATEAVQTAAEKATSAVDKLTVAQFKTSAQALINKIAKLPGAYKATAYEAALLGKAMPSIDKAIESQTAAVTKLDEALQGLQATQLLGTKAASDEAFASEQEVKKLELQKLDLKIAGVVDDDPAVKAIDEQIAAIQLRAERAALAASIGLDPLKKKLEDTFNPVKELSFDAIIKQFTSLTAARKEAQGSLTKTTALKATLDKIVAASADKFADVGLSVSQGIVAGTEAGKPAVAKAGKDTANTLVTTTKKALGIASPSTVMATIGLQSSQGYALGILSGRPAVVAASSAIRIAAVNSLLTGVPFFRAAGVQSLAGFKEGMQSVWKTSGKWGNSLQEFVLGIATWIQKNKGPISYDAQLLRPAGEAIMSGFKRGLNDGFGEVKTWVGKVGPSIGENFPKELMFERSARFLLNNYKADATFTPEDAFSDLMPDVYGVGGGAFGGLSFLHKTKSFADTLKMGKQIAKLYGMSITGSGEAAGHVVGSQHPLGQAIDLSNSGGSDWDSSSRTPEMEKLRKDLMPYLSKYLHQVIYAEKIWRADGASPTGAFGPITNSNPHNAHVHVGWKPDSDFSRNSGKLGDYGLDIPGVPARVIEAINAAASATNLHPAYIAAMSKIESGFQNLTSPAGAQGWMQLMPGTFAGLVRGGNIDDMEDNYLAGAKYMKNLLDRFGSLQLMAAAYNAGPNAPGLSQGQIPPYSETQNHVKKFLEALRQLGFGGLIHGIGNFRAMGGNVNANTPYVVGERGREVFIPDRSGTVISNKNVEGLIRMAQEGKMSAGAGTTVNYEMVNNIQSNSTDNAAVAALVDAKVRSQLVGIRR